MNYHDKLALEYETLVKAVQFVENVRWARLSNYLFANTLLVLACTAILGVHGYSFVRWYLLLIFCIAGFVCGIAWSVLGYRTSTHVTLWIKSGSAIEKNLFGEVFNDHKEHMYFYASTNERNKLPWARALFSSTSIVTIVPLIFSVIFGLFPWLGYTILNP
jgi:hypothetical protein